MRERTKLDKAIEMTAYISDCLISLRNIQETGCCNECSLVRICAYRPRPGQMCRYNCPFFAREEETR